MAEIHEACRKGDAETVRRLIEADPQLADQDDEHHWRPVFHAALYRQTDVVRLLIDAGADLAAHDGYVLHYAAEVPNNQEIVDLLIAYGVLDAHVRPTDDLSRQFLAALFLNNCRRITSMLARSPHLAVQPDGRGDLPIHHAARNGAAEIVRSLIASGADVNSVNLRGHTVLYCAAGHGHLETVRILLSNNVAVGTRFTDDEKNICEWLEQYPNDARFRPVLKEIRRHNGQSS